MSRIGGDVLKVARISAKLGREPAAEELHIHSRTLDAYESMTDEREPGFEMLRDMARLYKNPMMPRLYIKRSPIGEFFPEIVESIGETFQSSTLITVNKFYGVNDSLKQLIRIASDGHVNDCERQDWEALRKELQELIDALTVLLLVQK